MTSIPIAMRELTKMGNHVLLQSLIEQAFILDDHSRKEVAEQLTDIIRVAVECGDVEAVRSLRSAETELEKTLPAEYRSQEQRNIDPTLLHRAIELKNLQMVSYLLVSIDANARDHEDGTALHYAVRRKQAKDLIITLLSFGADMSARDYQGCTPLHIASHNDRGENVSCLLDAGAQVDVCDNAGMTPLHHCAFSQQNDHQNSSSPAMSLLIKRGASLSVLDKDGYTPLHLALEKSIKSPSPQHLINILDVKADLISTRFPPLDRTLLHLAAESDCRSSILDVLFWRKADLEAEDKNGKTPAQIAGGGAHRWLINHGAQWRE